MLFRRMPARLSTCRAQPAHSISIAITVFSCSSLSKAMLASKCMWGKVKKPSLEPKVAKPWDWDTSYQNLSSARHEFSSQPKSIAAAGDDGNVTEQLNFCLRAPKRASLSYGAQYRLGAGKGNCGGCVSSCRNVRSGRTFLAQEMHTPRSFSFSFTKAFLRLEILLILSVWHETSQNFFAFQVVEIIDF